MNIRRFQGVALVISAVLLLVGYFGPDVPYFHILAVIGTIVFILGIPAIQTNQPTGPIGLVGIVLAELAAIIALAFQLGFIASPSLGGVLSLISAIAGMAGRIIVGWLTTKRKVFPAWVGWAFIAEGLLNFIGGVFNFGSLVKIFSLIATLLGMAALLGYGFVIFRKHNPEITA